MNSIIISKPDKVLKGSIQLPSSKSISNRLLIMQALSGKKYKIDNLSEAEDTVLLQRLLEVILNCNAQNKVMELDTGNAGTAMRFLTSFLSMRQGKWVLTGSERMKQRPIGILAEAMNCLGASIDFLAKPGYPPLLIRGNELHGRELTIDSGISSQFTTALLLIAPYLPEGMILHLKGKTVSSPYAMMTIRLMQFMGAKIKIGKTRLHVSPGAYQFKDVDVESDWSSAAFWYELAVFSDDVDIELLGLQRDSLQGDAVLPVIYKNFGILTEFTDRGIRLTKVRKKIDGFYFDFTNFPDLAQAVIATCAGIGIRGRFEGVRSLQIKETDRLRALKNELEKLGIQVSFFGDGGHTDTLEIMPVKPSFPSGITFETYGDHRTAMALAPLVLKTGILKILNPDAVAKSYPYFWNHLKSVGFDIH
ncbi:MAG: 3-phosphoshikimate 1-carboxyvinyltransferase [Bacteroidetes bacterium]|nr:3-phosphoshikimate 1-carboxyvinyltransferase [Bacteroidota bacterium]